MNLVLYLYLALTAVLATNAYTGVRDIDGNIIYGGSYYIVPKLRAFGGVDFKGRGDQPCPLDIVQTSSDYHGIPVKFSNWRPGVAFVPESEDLNIQMDVGATICINGLHWKVGEFDGPRRQYFVMSGLNQTEPGKQFSKSLFKIVKSGDNNTYKFVYSPRHTCDPKCSDVGIFVDELGIRRLALRDEPFLVRFKKTNVTKVSSMAV